MDGDLYPNDGGMVPVQQDEQAKAEQEERRKVSQSIPVLDDLISHVQERIDFYNSLDSIPSTDKTTPTELLRQVNARKLAKQLLEDELTILETFKRQYT